MLIKHILIWIWLKKFERQIDFSKDDAKKNSINFLSVGECEIFERKVQFRFLQFRLSSNANKRKKEALFRNEQIYAWWNEKSNCYKKLAFFISCIEAFRWAIWSSINLSFLMSVKIPKLNMYISMCWKRFGICRICWPHNTKITFPPFLEVCFGFLWQCMKSRKIAKF